MAVKVKKKKKNQRATNNKMDYQRQIKNIVKRTRNRNEKGFSYIDVMIAIVIMLVGVLALASALTANLIRSYETDKRIIAKQLAFSSIESIIAARNIRRSGTIKGWVSIGNIGSNFENGVPNGIFVIGWTPIREDLGWDGISGTIDDACPASSACNVSGRPINDSEVLLGFERKIVITDVQDPERPAPPNDITRRNIEVSIKYSINGIKRDVVVSTLVTDYQ